MLIFLSSNNPDAIREILINNTQGNCSLEFTATQTGTFTITLNVVRPGYNPARQEINITVENHAPTVKAGQAIQTGTAAPAANRGNPAAVTYTADASEWFEAADTEDTLWYYPISTLDQDSNDVSVVYWPSEGKIEYTPAAAQASKTVTIVVKAMDSKTKTDSTSNVTITVNVGAIPEDANIAPTIKTDQAIQTGTAVPAANSGNPAADKYTADASAWFEDADGNALTYAVVSATDEDSADIIGNVTINANTGAIEYTPVAAQASKIVTIIVKANDGKADSISNVTIRVNVIGEK